MATLDTSTTYTLTNSYIGDDKLLSISSTDATTPQMLLIPPLNNTNSSPLPINAQWFLTPTDTPPFYRLHNRAGGDSRCLDVLNTGPALRMSETGHINGQYWRFDMWPGDGTTYNYRLSNNLTGLEMHLDVYSDTLEPHLAGGDYTGQHWRLEAVQTLTSVGDGVGRETGVGKESSHSAGAGGLALSTGAIVGISVGAVVAFALAMLGCGLVVMRRSRARKEALERGLKTPSSTDTVWTPCVHPPFAELQVGLHPDTPVELATVQTELRELA